jgi:molybdenum cofactor cytidylyltransferase
VKFGSVPTGAAEGAFLAHAVQAGEVRFKKGTRLGAPELAALRAAGIAEVIVAQLNDRDIAEDVAAAGLAASAAHPSVRIAAPSTGRVNIHAETDGLFVVDRAAIDAINRVDPSITIATLAEFAPVVRGQMVATVKIIPFAVPAEKLDAAIAAAKLASPLLKVAPWAAKPVGLVATELPSLKSEVMDKTTRILQSRLARSGSTLMQEVRVPHHEDAVAHAIKSLIAEGAGLVVVFGASAVVDPHDVIPEGIRRSGGKVTQVGMPVDPGNLLVLGKLGTVPVIGAPGCARSPKENGFDWVLDRTLCGIDIKPIDFAGMGVGGLLMEIETRPRPRDTISAKRLPKLDAILLAAGSSSRMGGSHKLRALFDGEPLLRRSARVLSAVGARSVTVVLGHDADRMAALLPEYEGKIIVNPDHAEGLASSLRAGIASLPNDSDGALVHLADMPGVTPDALQDMSTAFTRSGGQAIVRATHGGKRGNPVILPRSVYSQVARLTGDTGARAIVEGFAGQVIDVEIGEAASLDVDTPEAVMAAGGLISD